MVVGSGKQAQVAEVVGRRARLTLAAPAGVRKGDKITLAAQAPGPTADPPPTVPQRSWRPRPPAVARDDVAFQAQWQAWHAAWSPYLDPPRVHGRDPASRVDGTFTALAAVVASGAQPWALVRLGSQLAWSGVGGTPLGWQHDVSLWIDQLGWSPRAAGRRLAQVRQAQVVWQPADGVGPRWALGRL
ncbi:MAG: hypothetical protein FJ100_20705, partial [Deltaproteobacteria bacterium]|nr:hypothetical protein [Deltaproteobacteria bacterium]